MESNLFKVNEGVINNERIDLMKLYFIFRRRWFIIFGSLIIFFITAYIYVNFLQAPIYGASTMLFVYRSNDTASMLNNEINIGAQLVKDVASILKSGPVIDETIKRIGSPKGLSRQAVYDGLNSSIIKETRLLKITVTSKDAKLAAKIANTVSGVLIERFDIIMKAKAKSGEEFISIVENAQPDFKSLSMNKKFTIMEFSLFGFILGSAVVLLLDYFNNSVKSQDEIEWYMGSNVIATIPKYNK